MAGTLNWLDQTVPFRRADGTRVTATPLQITRDYADPPLRLSAVDTGHPFVDRGFEGLMRDLLQIALPPRNDRDWAERLLAPPSLDQLAAAFEPYRQALMIDDDATPAMQVRPSEARLAEMRKQKKKRTKPASQDDDREDEEDDTDTGTPLPIAMLLPEQPTADTLKNGRDFFIHGRSVDAVAPGLVLPLLYSAMVLHPAAGGGYYGLPHGADSIKYQVVGSNLWETLWANVLNTGNPRLGGAALPPPCDQRVFPWLDSDLPSMSLQRKHPEATRDIGLVHRHPAAIPMPRRYVLDSARIGRCGLSGFEGAVFGSFRRWPNGLRYAAAGWQSFVCAEQQSFVPDGNGWRAKPKQRKDGQDSGPDFVKARGPLRYDDWLEAALGHEPAEPPNHRKVWERKLPAPVVQAFIARQYVLGEGELTSGGPETRRGSVLGGELPFRVRAMGMINEGKVAVATAERSLPLFALNTDEAEALPYTISSLVEALANCADKLAQHARQAVKLGRDEAKPRLDIDLRDALLQAMDAEVTALPERLVQAWRTEPDRDEHSGISLRLKDEILRQAKTQALAFFDEAFPLVTLDAMTMRVARERRRLAAALESIVGKHGPAVRQEQGK